MTASSQRGRGWLCPHEVSRAWGQEFLVLDRPSLRRPDHQSPAFDDPSKSASETVSGHSLRNRAVVNKQDFLGLGCSHYWLTVLVVFLMPRTSSFFFLEGLYSPLEATLVLEAGCYQGISVLCQPSSVQWKTGLPRAVPNLGRAVIVILGTHKSHS